MDSPIIIQSTAVGSPFPQSNPAQPRKLRRIIYWQVRNDRSQFRLAHKVFWLAMSRRKQLKGAARLREWKHPGKLIPCGSQG
jgi:hypothetical protein